MVNYIALFKHRKMAEDEVLELLKRYKIDSVYNLPKIKLKDSALRNLEDLKVGDVIEILRTEDFSGQNKYYRVIIN